MAFSYHKVYTMKNFVTTRRKFRLNCGEVVSGFSALRFGSMYYGEYLSQYVTNSIFNILGAFLTVQEENVRLHVGIGKWKDVIMHVEVHAYIQPQDYW